MHHLLQLIQNTAAGLVFNLLKSFHTTATIPSLASCSWRYYMYMYGKQWHWSRKIKTSHARRSTLFHCTVNPMNSGSGLSGLMDQQQGASMFLHPGGRLNIPHLWKKLNKQQPVILCVSGERDCWRRSLIFRSSSVRWEPVYTIMMFYLWKKIMIALLYNDECSQIC